MDDNVVRAALTSLLCGEFHHVAVWALEAVIGHNHVHVVFWVWHQVAEDTHWLIHSAVETFGLLFLIDRQTWNHTGVTPVVQLREKQKLKKVNNKVNE